MVEHGVAPNSVIKPFHVPCETILPAALQAVVRLVRSLDADELRRPDDLLQKPKRTLGGIVVLDDCTNPHIHPLEGADGGSPDAAVMHVRAYRAQPELVEQR